MVGPSACPNKKDHRPGCAQASHGSGASYTYHQATPGRRTFSITKTHGPNGSEWIQMDFLQKTGQHRIIVSQGNAAADICLVTRESSDPLCVARIGLKERFNFDFSIMEMNKTHTQTQAHTPSLSLSVDLCRLHMCAGCVL